MGQIYLSIICTLQSKIEVGLLQSTHSVESSNSFLTNAAANRR